MDKYQVTYKGEKFFIEAAPEKCSYLLISKSGNGTGKFKVEKSECS